MRHMTKAVPWLATAAVSVAFVASPPGSSRAHRKTTGGDARAAGSTTAFQVQPPNSPSKLAFDRGGVLHQNYTEASGNSPSVLVHKSYVAVPHKPFIIVSYKLANQSHSATSFNFMDNLELNNKQ